MRHGSSRGEEEMYACEVRRSKDEMGRQRQPKIK